ncbi:MAG: hypothetical protein IME92_09480 [Proteobacteria bacterium]|nr:hypothetical protein [Pseudomonadota bacterium]
MTALDKFERLESLGLWKETDTSQKKEVIVSFGKASLVLSDHKDTPLTHWALGAVEITAASDEKVIYTPDKKSFETLEISDPTMNRAIKKVRKLIHRPRSHRGRIRILSTVLITLCICFLAIFWLPTALADYTTNAVSDAKAREIGAKLMPHINQYAGRPCGSVASNPVIRKLENRLIGSGKNTLFIADLGARYSTHLPGGIILVNRVLVENFPNPGTLAGFILMERALQDDDPALHALFIKSGPIATLTFLITGNIDDSFLEGFAKSQMTKPLVLPDRETMLGLFKSADISAAPLAKTLNDQDLLAENPVTGSYAPILTDPEWLALQSICEG